MLLLLPLLLMLVEPRFAEVSCDASGMVQKVVSNRFGFTVAAC